MPGGIVGWIIIFVLSLGFLLRASDKFIEAAERIGLSLGIPSFVIGLTLVALGTSIPELASSIFAVLEGASEIVAGNVAGSNITNTLLVLGVVLLVAPTGKFKADVAAADLIFLVAATFIFTYGAWDGVFSFAESMFCILGIFLYMGYQLFSYLRNKQESEEDLPPTDWRDFLIILISGVFIYFSAKYNIEAIQAIAKIVNIGVEYIALTAVALGTSLPELFVSIAAVRKGNIAMALGNVLGSNIFNIFAVMGFPGLIGSLKISPVILSVSVPLLLISTLLLISIVYQKTVTKWRAAILLMLYAYFFIQLLTGVVTV